MYDFLYLINHVIPAITIAYLVYIWTRTNAIYDFILKWNVFNILPFVKSYKTYIETAKVDFNVWLQTKTVFAPKFLAAHSALSFGRLWLQVYLAAIMCLH